MKTYINKNITKGTFTTSPFLYTLADFLNTLEKNPDEPIFNLNKNFTTLEKYNYISILEKDFILNKTNVNSLQFLMHNYDENNFYYHKRICSPTKRIAM
jgi:hypothetical protein